MRISDWSSDVCSSDLRLAVRQAESASIIADMLPWFEEMLPKLPRGSNTAEAIRYTLNHWKGLIRFLDDGRIELDNNTVERAIRPITLQRKNALFTGHEDRKSTRLNSSH